MTRGTATVFAALLLTAAGAFGVVAAFADGTTNLPRARVAEVASDSAPSAAASPTATAGTATVVVSDADSSATLHLEIANTPLEREIGLMNRKSLPADGGMLFLFPRDGVGAFWMKDTYVPLDIAFVASNGTVVHIAHGKPLDLTPLYPGALYRYVIEVNDGWFAAHGLGMGALVTLPSGLPAAQ